MKIGFTGTRDGMTVEQMESIDRWVTELGWWEEFHHGCCVGADKDVEAVFHSSRVSKSDQQVHAHPSDMPAMTVRNLVDFADVKHKPKPPLERNRDIVNACDVLLVCPKGPEELRSGTWSTVRFARQCGKRVVVFWPDGSISEECS